MGKVIKFPGKFRKKLSKSDRQTIEALELVIEYAGECGCDISAIEGSQDLGELARSLHILFRKMNHEKPDDINWERSIDLGILYNRNGFLHPFDKDED